MVSQLEILATLIFACAVLHTLGFGYIRQRLKWKFFSEVELVFGFWAFIFVLCLLFFPNQGLGFLSSLDFTEPFFVVVIMIVASSPPVIAASSQGLRLLAHFLPLPSSLSLYFVLLFIGPLLGSFITEPAAMTVLAQLIGAHFFDSRTSNRFKYATLASLLVNVSIGGCLTAFAAPPILMVAKTWGWNSPFVFNTFGWRAIVAVFINASFVTFLFRNEIRVSEIKEHHPVSLSTIYNFLLLAGIVLYAHTPVMLGALLLLFYLARFNRKVAFHNGLFVGVFLAGLIILGTWQRWWVQPLLMSLKPNELFWSATGLTAFLDNAALTFLGSQVEGLSEPSKYFLVAGAVTGGGLTVIANAPNPTAFSILKGHFGEKGISALKLFFSALIPTMVAMLSFYL